MIYVYGYVDSQMYEKEIEIVRKYSWAKVKKKFYEDRRCVREYIFVISTK